MFLGACISMKFPRENFDPCVCVCDLVFWGLLVSRDCNIIEYCSCPECPCPAYGAHFSQILIALLLFSLWFFRCTYLSLANACVAKLIFTSNSLGKLPRGWPSKEFAKQI